MAATVEKILIDSIQQGLGLPRDPIATDIRDLALAAYNEHGRIIWDVWPWDNEKMDEFTAPAADSDGIITFASTVDTVRAIKGNDANSDSSTRIWNQDDLLAASRGVIVDTERFLHLADDSSGNRRIRISTENTQATYTALALKRWVDAVVDPNYDPLDPSATPTDYRVETFIVDTAEPALRAYIKDTLRRWQGMATEKNGDKLLNIALKREVQDADRERRINPRQPMFGDVGNWHQ